MFHERFALETTLPVCKTFWDFQAHQISVWVTCTWKEWTSNDFIVFSQSTKEEDIFPRQRRLVFLLSSFGQILLPKLYSLLGVVRNFRSFFKSVFQKNLLGLPPPPDFRTKKGLMGIPMYTCTSMYLNTHTSFVQGHSSTPLPFATTTSLTTPHCAMFIELFLLEHLRCFCVTDDRRRVFCGNTVHDSHAQRAAVALRTHSGWSPSARIIFAGGSLGTWRTSVSRHNMNARTFRTGWRQS